MASGAYSLGGVLDSNFVKYPIEGLATISSGGNNTFGELIGVNENAVVGGAAAGASKITKVVDDDLSIAVAQNLKRFKSKMPSNSKDSITVSELEGGNYLFKAESPGKVPGSKAVCEKVVDSNGHTINMIKTTFDPDGNIIHVKQK